MVLPQKFLERLDLIPNFNKEEFLEAHLNKQATISLRLNTNKALLKNLLDFQLGYEVPWSNNSYYLEQRPNFALDPLWHSGAYYVQEASSMFIATIIKQLTLDKAPIIALDACAAPGGKTTLLQQNLHHESIIIANEIIGNRNSILQENIMKWGCTNVLVTQANTNQFNALPLQYDLILIDAPCSGSGLFRKDPNAINEWSEENVQQCGIRQQEILNNLWPCLKENGILIYATCSYDILENEAQVDYILENFDAEIAPIDLENDWGITITETQKKGIGYRFYPSKVEGEGFFASCFKKISHSNIKNFKKPSTSKKITASNAIKESFKPFINYNIEEDIVALNHTHYLTTKPVSTLLEQLYGQIIITYAGCGIGNVLHGKWVPHEATAFNRSLLKDKITEIELNKADSLDYLRKTELSLQKPKNLYLLTYKEQGLGFINHLGNRINNLYPKNWKLRIE
jgi:16S rRNA C967 or C1407 C5-methylase (RsmB/RsmF family)/NOL1/NOP2/fmu family ribosome biogenesis protein